MIRIANDKDINHINILGNLLYTNFENKYDIESYLKNNNYIILVNVDSEVNGVLIVYKNIDYFELETIVTNPNFRNMGIATNLFKYFVENYCKKNEEIILEVSSNNENARNLYNNLGFIEIGIRKKYYGEFDAILMKKVI